MTVSGRSDPMRYLHATAWDSILAAVFAALHYRWLAVPGADRAPAWLWPALALVFLLSALWHYGKYRRLRGRPRR